MLDETTPLSEISPALETTQTLDDLRDELLPDSVETPEESQKLSATPQRIVGWFVSRVRIRWARVVWSRRLKLDEVLPKKKITRLPFELYRELKAEFQERLKEDSSTHIARARWWQAHVAYSRANRPERIRQQLKTPYHPTPSKDSLNAHARADDLLMSMLEARGVAITRSDRHKLLDSLLDDLFGYGPLQPLLEDPSITMIMVNGPKDVFFGHRGQIRRAAVAYHDDAHVMHHIDRIIASQGGEIDDNSPLYEAQLSNGSQVTAVLPPVAVNGPSLTIQKFSKKPFQIEDLIRFGSMTPEMGEFLRACVIARLNVVVSGGTNAGKTTLANILAGFIWNTERIITIEETPALKLRQENVLSLACHQPDINRNITMADLVEIAERMRPDRLVIDNLKGPEAFRVIQAMNSGYDGTIATLHSNSPRDTLLRLETMCMMAGMSLSPEVIRYEFASAVDLIVHQERLRTGTRKIVKVTEVQGIDKGEIILADIFIFEKTGVEAGRVIGRIKPTGLRPKFIRVIEEAGIHLPPAIFGIGPPRY